MDVIKHFCSGTERISINTDKVECLDTQQLNIDFKKDSIKRFRISGNGDCFFSMELIFAENITLKEQIKHMHTIELFYPELFDWRFNGDNIECYAIIPMCKKNLGIFGRYRGVYGFIRQLRERLINVIKFRGFEHIQISKFITNMVYSNGSINHTSDTYVVNIEPHWELIKILMHSKSRKCGLVEVKKLDMRYWIKEINPDFTRKTLVPKLDKIPITDDVYKYYPPCILKLAKMKRKGNYNRFLLSTFLLSMHTERDAKHQLLTMLSDDEREHILTGNCKDQWRAVVTKGYSGPSCKTLIECGFCDNDCGRPYPHFNEDKGGKK